MKNRIPFGPVPSRRLGRSLGINNLPSKICTFSCVYCQVGKTLKFTKKRQAFYKPEEIRDQVEEKVRELKNKDERIDYLSFVPNGEAALDINLGREIELLKDLGIPIAVITNSSLITLPDVREALKKADWVSLKVDAVSEELWRRINRPLSELKLPEILEGMVQFSRNYSGKLNTETMFIEGINDSKKEMERIADFIQRVHPLKSYIAIPTRPPTLNWVKPPPEEKINIAYSIFNERLDNVELLIGYAGGEFASTYDVRGDILDIISVHPMRKGDIEEILKDAGEDWSVVKELIEKGEIKKTEFNNKIFFVRAYMKDNNGKDRR